MAKFVFRGVEYKSFEDYSKAVDAADVEAAKVAAERDALKAASAPSSDPVQISIRGGKLAVFFRDSALAYQGRAFEHFGAPMEALIAAWPLIEAAYLNNKAKIVPTWQAYADLPIGATLPDGTAKPAPKAKK